MINTLQEAVALVRQGNNEGKTFLYEHTYKKAYYVALKYVKNDDDALDIVQDSYIKAFDRIDQLDNDLKFESWLNTIVASTAMDFLRKKKPQLFTDMSKDDEEYDVADRFEADYAQQPEVVMDQNETSRLVQEIIGELSDEQRVCVTMYYMQEMSVKEISGVLDVSDNTVKSRLNYARKNIEAKVKELEKKGTKLYALAPIPFFVFLLGKEASACEATAAAGLYSAGAASAASGATGVSGTAGTSAGATTSTTTGATGVGGSAGAGTTTGASSGAAATGMSLGAKLAIGITAGVLVIGGAVGVGVAVSNSGDDETEVVEEQHEESKPQVQSTQEALSSYYDSTLVQQYGVADKDFVVNFDGEPEMLEVREFASKPGLMGKKFVDVDNDGAEEMIVPVAEFSTKPGKREYDSVKVKLLIYKSDAKTRQVSEITNGQIVSQDISLGDEHIQCAYRMVDGLFYTYFTAAATHGLSQGVFYGSAVVYSFDGKTVTKLVDYQPNSYYIGTQQINMASSYMPSIVNAVNAVIPTGKEFFGTLRDDFVLFKPLSQTDSEYKDIFSWYMYKDRSGKKDTMTLYDGRGTIHGYWDFFQ